MEECFYLMKTQHHKDGNQIQYCYQYLFQRQHILNY